jgi:hypothetical protein
MTPKEKAQELADKFYQTTPNEAWINEPLGISEEYKAWKQAKQCALIAVNEIIEALLEYDNRNNTYELQNMDRDFNYWEQVKQEIENL